MDVPSEIIETDRLLLRRPIPEDASARYEYGCDPDVVRFMDWVPHPTLEAFLAHAEDDERRWAAGAFSWVITIKPESRAVGSIGCHVRGQEAELGFLLGREIWGYGYATEAAGAVIGWVAKLKDVCRVWATCDVENVPSARVLEKIGMKQEGVLRKAVIRPNIDPTVPRDALLYSWIR